MKKIIFSFLCMVTMSLLMVGCGSSTEKALMVPSTESKSDQATTETRVVKTARGDVEIPANPQRIADVSGISDMLYILGIKPVATADSDAYDHTKFPVYLQKELAGATIVGYPMSEAVDIEGVLSSSPDLIIINPRQEKAFDQLSKIAPTIVINPDVNDWRADLRMVSELFDKKEIAEKYIADYEEKTKAAGEAIKAANGEDRTYFAFLTGGGNYYLFTGAAYGDIFYNDMGLGVPKALPAQDSITLPTASLEGLTEIDADYMVVLASDEDKAALEASLVWNSIRAVKEGHVIWLPQSPYFNQAYSVYGKSSLVDELKTLLIQK